MELEWNFTFTFFAIKCNHFLLTIEPFVLYIIRGTKSFALVAIGPIRSLTALLTLSNWDKFKFCKNLKVIVLGDLIIPFISKE